MSFVINFMTTRSCNLECFHCCIDALPLSFSDLPDKKHLENLLTRTLDFCRYLRFFGDIEFVFYGGEPFCLPEGVLFSLTENFTQVAISEKLFSNVRVLTNLMYDNKIKNFIKHFSYISISTSFDPIIRFKNKHLESKWLRTYRGLRESIEICVDFTLTRYLVGFDFIKFVVENGIDNFSVSLLRYIGRARRHWNSLSIPLNVASCFLTKITSELPYNYIKTFIDNLKLSGMKCHSSCADVFLIDLNGDVYLGTGCNMIFLGNLFKENYENIFFSPKRLEVINSFPEECRFCDYFDICRGGCLNLRSLYKEFLHKDGECIGLKSLLEKVFKNEA
ncbi:MAG: SPASM domain-containing protein [Caldisericum sp.]